MLLFSLPLVFTLVGIFTVNGQEEIKACFAAHLEGLDDMAEASAADELRLLCPKLQLLLKCIDDAVEEATDYRLEQIAEMFPTSKAGKMARLFLNVHGIFEEVCEEGTDLHNAYTEHADCFQTIDRSKTEECVQESSATAEVTENAIEEEITENPNSQCLRTALASACLSAEIHENCGVEAFEYFQTVLKRTNVFRLTLCSQEDIDELKSNFLDSLNVEGERKDLFRSAFDLRKRRK